MTTCLFDVNLLLALTDPMHIHHEPTHRWFAGEGQRSWATCTLTENAFVRIASHPSYPNRPGDVLAACAILRQFCQLPGHQFWAEDISIRDILRPGAIITHTQITDAYLVGLAVHNKGKLATLDKRIPVHAVEGGREAVELVPV